MGFKIYRAYRQRIAILFLIDRDKFAYFNFERESYDTARGRVRCYKGTR